MNCPNVARWTEHCRWMFVVVMLTATMKCLYLPSENNVSNEFSNSKATIHQRMNLAATELELAEKQSPFVVVLGIAQDAGYPQAGCRLDCCKNHEGPREGPSCLALVDPESGERWLFECTPDFPEQLRKLDNEFETTKSPGINGIFLTHAHIGHYAGLIHLGREVMGAREVPVFAMPRMSEFLTSNGPWNQLVKLKNIQLQTMTEGSPVRLNERLMVTPITVPHRDEFSETVAYRIQGPDRTVLFLPDIDKWERWETKIEDLVATVDVAYLDATFFDGNELPGRDIKQIPHPFVIESIERFGHMDAEQRGKIRFIHLNHTNPALRDDSAETQQINRAGMGVARTLETIAL